MDWDWDEQRADTFATVQHLIEAQGVPEGASINLDIQTVAALGAGPLAKAAFASALTSAGYTFEITANEDGDETIEVTVEGVLLNADEIWACEKAVSELALAYQWVPDGWGFWEP